MYLIPCVLGFALCCLFDFCKFRRQGSGPRFLFPLGCLLIGASAVWAALECGPSFRNYPCQSGLFLTGTLLFAALTVYVLFFALPFQTTYLENQELPVVRSGVYGLCRHPGFWPFAGMFLCLAGFFRELPMWACAGCAVGCNLIYIFLQDRFLFPGYIRGYCQYRKEVPFLLPRPGKHKKSAGKALSGGDGIESGSKTENKAQP